MGVKAKFALAAACFVMLAIFIFPAACAQDGFDISVTATPPDPEVGQKVTIGISITDTGTELYQKLVLTVYVDPDSATVPGAAISPNPTITNLSPGRSANVTVEFIPRKAESHSVTVNIYRNTTDVANLKYQEKKPSVITARGKPGPVSNGPPLMLVVAGAVMAVAAVAGILFALYRKKKAGELRARPVERAPEQPVEERVEGKFPKDYYKFRREKFSRLKPVGLTRSGNTILGNIEKNLEQDAALEAPAPDLTCPKCGITMEANWKTCKNCGALSTIEKAQGVIDRLEKLGGSDVFLKEMLATAEACRDAKNYDEAETYAHDVLDRARNQLRKREEAQKAAAPAPSYSAGESATREGAPAGSAEPAATGATAARGYAEAEEAAPGYQPPSVEKEYSDMKAAGPSKKKEPNPCWKCGQGLRPEWKKCPYCNAPQEGICPSCGRTVKMRWNNCPQCRADLTIDKPRPACPVCGVELPPAGDCQSCKARALLDTTARLVKEVKAKGADVVEAEALVGRGELAIKIKNFEKAVAHFIRAEELAKKARKEYRTRKLRERLAHVGTVLKDAAGEGADVSAARQTLARAQQSLADDSIDEGLSLVEQASGEATEALNRSGAAPSPIPISVKKPVVVSDVKVKPRCCHCQEQVEESWTVCQFCQSGLSNRCPKCGADIKAGWKICPMCESPLP